MTTPADILRRARELVGPYCSEYTAMSVAMKEAVRLTQEAAAHAYDLFVIQDQSLDRAIAAAEREEQ